MTNQALAEAFLPLFVELHAKVKAMPEGEAKDDAERHLRVFHGAGDRFMKCMVDHREVEPFSGGTPDPNKEP